jgi:hypothetical protein
MITRDIALQDCIFDLLDNSIDGARRTIPADSSKPLEGFGADIQFDRSGFKISDNCGGIRLSDAIDHAFHFGRKPDSPLEVDGGIGLYGIGMKRAIFKMGDLASVRSDAEDACFIVSVNVPEWERSPSWEFEYEDAERSGVRGTSIAISAPKPGIESAFGDPIFQNELIRQIARDYAFFIAKGFSITVNHQLVPSYKFELRSNENLAPALVTYEDGPVHVRISAGLIDDLSDDIPDNLLPKDVERFGWYVICNDRIVLAADKTDKTIWGDDGFAVWHPQYNGFAGFVFFEAEDQRLLPWTTTKRSIDVASPLFRRSLRKLKEPTAQFIAYTNQRKADLESAKSAERAMRPVDVYSTVRVGTETRAMTLPKFQAGSSTDAPVTIAYKRKPSELDEIRKYLGQRTMANAAIGVHTFEYFCKVELGK